MLGIFWLLSGLDGDREGGVGRYGYTSSARGQLNSILNLQRGASLVLLGLTIRDSFWHHAGIFLSLDLHEA